MTRIGAAQAASSRRSNGVEDAKLLPLRARATPPATRVGFAPVSTDIVGRTHQIDNLASTNWQTTRCSASSAVAVAALAGKAYLEGLAFHVVRSLEERADNLWRLLDVIASEDKATRHAASKTFLPELQRHVSAFSLSFQTALAELGFDRSPTPGVGVGVPYTPGSTPFVISDQRISVGSADPMSTQVTLARSSREKDLTWFVRPNGQPLDAQRIDVPVMHQRIPWVRTESGSVDLEHREVEMSGAGHLLALYQAAGCELQLLDRVVSCVEAQLQVARAVYEDLRRTSASDPVLLQNLADKLLFAEQRSERGLNAAEAGHALQGAGLMVTPLKNVVDWKDLARTAGAGDSLLLKGRAHAVVFGRMSDGRSFVYDSEGIQGDRLNKCLAFVAPGEDAALDAYYAGFQATHRVRSPKAHDIFAMR